MYKSKKATALFLALVMMFSLALNPLSAVYAGTPSKLPISKDEKVPDTKSQIIKPSTTPSPPTIAPKQPVTTTPNVPIKRVEQPAKAQGVNYEIKEDVKKLPTGIQYGFKPLTLDKFVTFEVEANMPKINPSIKPGVNLPSTQEPSQTTQDENTEPFDKVNGIKYPAGSKLLTIPKSVAASFTPQNGEIYIDENEGNAFRILSNEGQDEQGNDLYAVETPDLLEVFKSYSIPEQTINLTTGNIAYIDPDFELSPESGMPKNYVAKADGSVVYEDQVVKVTTEGNKHILTLKSDVMIFEYPPKDLISDKDKKKFKGDKEKEEYYSDLKGVENKSEFSVAVRVKDGSNIIIENPKLNASLDLNLLTSQLDANFSFDCKATADVTLVGDMVFNYTLEKCVYGYDVSLGKVGGKEKGNAAFIGIFLVLGLNGKIHVEVRTITTGDAEAGFAYKSVGWGSLPYYVGPYATFRPSSFDMSFTVDGEVHATLACVPQVGVVIWGIELGMLQVWVGFKSTARFHFEGGGGTDTEESFGGNGSIDLRAFGELVGYLIGSRYSIFYIEFPIYKGEWKIGEEVSGSGGDMVRKVPPYVRVAADAYTNKVEGKVAFCTAGKTTTGYLGDDEAALDAFQPYYDSSFSFEVYDKDMRAKFSRTFETDSEGRFSVQFTGNENIYPSDKIFINIEDFMSPEFTLEDGRKFKVVGKSPEITPTVPFTLMDFDVDTFNDVITGWVSGDYTGPINISMDKYINNKKTIDIQTANVQGGVFKFGYPIDQSIDWVSIYIDFEGSKYGAGPKLRNLDALTITTFNDYTKPQESSASQDGARIMQNMPMPGAPVPSTTAPGGVDTGVNLPDSLTSTQERLIDMSTKDAAGNRLIRPTKILGTITNKGDMGWLVKQGDNYVRSGTNTGNLNYFNGNVKITEIYVQSALEAMLKKYRSNKPWLGRSPQQIPFEATTQTRQGMGFKRVNDSNSPVGFTMQAYPTSAAKFEFNKPDVMAYKIEIEYEGITTEYIYNPFVYHYEESGRQSIEDFIGPLREAYRLRTQERIESVINPGDNIRDNIQIDKQRQMH